jgi:hypothetical protein
VCQAHLGAELDALADADQPEILQRGGPAIDIVVLIATEECAEHRAGVVGVPEIVGEVERAL